MKFLVAICFFSFYLLGFNAISETQKGVENPDKKPESFFDKMNSDPQFRFEQINKCRIAFKKDIGKPSVPFIYNHAIMNVGDKEGVLIPWGTGGHGMYAVTPSGTFKLNLSDIERSIVPGVGGGSSSSNKHFTPMIQDQIFPSQTLFVDGGIVYESEIQSHKSNVEGEPDSSGQYFGHITANLEAALSGGAKWLSEDPSKIIDRNLVVSQIHNIYCACHSLVPMDTKRFMNSINDAPNEIKKEVKKRITRHSACAPAR